MKGYGKAKPKVVDELCTCGCMRSVHTGAFEATGSCTRCTKCPKYTFKTTLYASQHMVRRPRKHGVKVRP